MGDFDTAAGASFLRGLIAELDAIFAAEPYVVWVGVALHVLLLLVMWKAIQEGSPDGMPSPKDRLFPTPGLQMKTVRE